jgi:hypothetical protein
MLQIPYYDIPFAIFMAKTPRRIIHHHASARCTAAFEFPQKSMTDYSAL